MLFRSAQFLSNIPEVRRRVEAQYVGLNYPMGGFLSDNAHAGMPFDPAVGTVSETSSDVLIPAFIAAYTGRSAAKETLDLFPSFASVMPNWRITYDGLINLGNLRNIFKTFTLSHAYQCTYSIGSFSSYLNWAGTGHGNLGFTLDELSGEPVSSCRILASFSSITYPPAAATANASTPAVNALK